MERLYDKMIKTRQDKSETTTLVNNKTDAEYQSIIAVCVFSMQSFDYYGVYTTPRFRNTPSSYIREFYNWLFPSISRC